MEKYTMGDRDLVPACYANRTWYAGLTANE